MFVMGFSFSRHLRNGFFFLILWVLFLVDIFEVFFSLIICLSCVSFLVEIFVMASSSDYMIVMGSVFSRHLCIVFFS